MLNRDKPHLIIPSSPAAEPFRAVNNGGPDKRVFRGDRVRHGRALKSQYEDAVGLSPGDECHVDEVDVDEKGTYVSFESFPDLNLALDSLDSLRAGQRPELVAVKEAVTSNGLVKIATVFIPYGEKRSFLNKLDKYLDGVSSGDTRPGHAKLIEGIANIRRATIRELWTDPVQAFPEDLAELRWWEVWLRKSDGDEVNRLLEYAREHGVKTSAHYLGFGDRTVILVEATADQLAMTFQDIDDLAELRLPHEVSSFLPSLSASEQVEWVDELTSRVDHADPSAPVVCILDGGVQQSHPLLRGSLALEDCHVADPDWNVSVIRSTHGTEMAGLALYHDLKDAVQSRQRITLFHRLESVKMLPDGAGNEPDVYGAITARAIDQPEISHPTRARIYMMAVTAPDSYSQNLSNVLDETRASGAPTAWSASIDALSFGRSIDDSTPKFTYLNRDEDATPRLFVISAGNIRDVNPADNHLDRSDLEAVEDPSQAWNALTVGAYAGRDAMNHAPDAFEGYVPLASRGELSPVSRTSVSFDRKRWPFKPEVVADGGNMAVSPDGISVDTPENLALLTTRLQRPGTGFYTTTRDTSAATAQVAAIAADIYAQYPGIRPETVRALIVHSAEWTDVMRDRIEATNLHSEAINLLRRYGMGVPSLERATRSASNALTLLDEAVIRPFERQGNSSSGVAREMNLHQLPWPIQELSDLGETKVRLRVTLSYFVEPNPSNRGWNGRYSYQSHGLRFAMKRSEDNLTSFRQRINKAANPFNEKLVRLSTEKGWLFGRDHQTSAGSLHTDIWTGPAINLASKEALVVYPVMGWWKNRPYMDKSEEGVHYSIVVSIEAPDVEVDLWTPVAQQISAVVEI